MYIHWLYSTDANNGNAKGKIKISDSIAMSFIMVINRNQTDFLGVGVKRWDWQRFVVVVRLVDWRQLVERFEDSVVASASAVAAAAFVGTAVAFEVAAPVVVVELEAAASAADVETVAVVLEVAASVVAFGAPASAAAEAALEPTAAQERNQGRLGRAATKQQPVDSEYLRTRLLHRRSWTVSLHLPLHQTP